MKFLNYGSINIDKVYSLNHIVKEGETISTSSYNLFPGGKGANQSVALANAGCEVYHAGKVGSDGIWIIELLKKYNVNTSFINLSKLDTGHAIIQVDEKGQNSIFINGGSNNDNSTEEANEIISNFSKGDYLIIQNEINLNKDLINIAKENEMFVCVNPSPFTSSILSWPLEKVDFLFVNEIEGSQIAKIEGNYELILDKLNQLFNKTHIIMTVGKDGAYYAYKNIKEFASIVDANKVDTTAAGDTFLGFFLASFSINSNPKKALEYASLASSKTISRKGAIPSIPLKNELIL